MFLGSELADPKQPEQKTDWGEAAGRFTGGVLDSLGYGKTTGQSGLTEVETFNWTPWLIGGGIAVGLGVVLMSTGGRRRRR